MNRDLKKTIDENLNQTPTKIVQKENKKNYQTPQPTRKMSIPSRPTNMIQSGLIFGSQSQSIPKNTLSSTGNQKFESSPLKNVKLPSITKSKTTYESNESNPENKIHPYYHQKLYSYFKTNDVSSRGNLYRKHFFETVQAIRLGKYLKIPAPFKEIKLQQKNQSHKTVFLDLDQTLIHCQDIPSKHSIKLNFKIQRGVVTAGIRIRPYCQQFLKQLSEIAEIIIFTASSSSYADVILDYLDPQNKYISHRLYRQHCTPSKGFFLKDLRIVNRKLQNCVLVDNLGFSFLLQINNGIPILPFYKNSNDNQLPQLLSFLKQITKSNDIRRAINDKFKWQKYLKETRNPKNIFLSSYIN